MNDEMNASGQNSGSCCCGNNAGKCDFCANIKWALNRAIKVIKDPVGVWDEIKSDGLSIKESYLKYAVPMAAIPAIGSLIHGIYSGAFPIVFVVITYIIALIALMVVAYIIKFISPQFSGTDDLTACFKLGLYSATPGYLAGVFHLIPVTAISSLLVLLASLYGIYVLAKSSNPAINIAKEKTAIFVVVLVVAYFIVSVVLGLLAAPFIIASAPMNQGF